MSRIVDIRHGRMAAVCAHSFECDTASATGQRPDPTGDGAEILLFPRFHRAQAERPRKRLTRRFQVRMATE